jgi:hypothetical protein
METRELLNQGWTEPSTAAPRRLITAVQGWPKSGKTHFALATAPEPVYYINADHGAEGVVEQFIRAGRQIVEHRVNIPDSFEMPEAKAKGLYLPIWEETKAMIRKAWANNQGTLVLDTETEIYELIRLARFGRLTQILQHHYGPVYAELNGLLRDAAYESDMSAIYIRKMDKDFNTGQPISKGYKNTPYDTQINVEVSRVQEPGESDAFRVGVLDCRHDPRLNRQYYNGPVATFEFLLNMVHGSR